MEEGVASSWVEEVVPDSRWERTTADTEASEAWEAWVVEAVGVVEDYSIFDYTLGSKPWGIQEGKVVAAEPEEAQGLQLEEGASSLVEEEEGHSSQLVDTDQGMAQPASATLVAFPLLGRW